MLLSSEFKNCDFGDKRLTDRVINLANSISANPECSINAASGSFSASKAAYRFFQNEKVNPNAILGKHVENTLERAKACHSRVLVIQDTTDLIYTLESQEFSSSSIVNDRNLTSPRFSGHFRSSGCKTLRVLRNPDTSLDYGQFS